MTVEQANFIGDFLTSSPDGLDDKIEGDNQFRLIKRCLQNTFGELRGRYSLVRERVGSYAIGLDDWHILLYLCGNDIVLSAELSPAALGEGFRLTVFVCAEGEAVTFEPGNGAYVNTVGTTSAVIAAGAGAVLMVSGGMWKVLAGLQAAQPPAVAGDPEPLTGWMFYTTKMGAGADSAYLYEFGTAAPSTVALGSNASGPSAARGGDGRFLFFADSAVGGKVVNDVGVLDDITSGSFPTLQLIAGNAPNAGYRATVYSSSPPVSAQISDGTTDRSYTQESTTSSLQLAATETDAYVMQEYVVTGFRQKITRYSDGATVYSRTDEAVALTSFATNYSHFAHAEVNYPSLLGMGLYINGTLEHNAFATNEGQALVLGAKDKFFFVVSEWLGGSYDTYTLRIYEFVWNGASYTKTTRTFTYTQVYNGTTPEVAAFVTEGKLYVVLTLVDCIGTGGAADNYYKILILDSDGGENLYYSYNLGVDGFDGGLPSTALKGFYTATDGGLKTTGYCMMKDKGDATVNFLSSAGGLTSFSLTGASLVAGMACSKTVAYAVVNVSGTYRLLGSDGTNVNLNTAIGLAPVAVDLMALTSSVYALVRTTSGGNRTWHVDKNGTAFEYSMPDTSAGAPAAPTPSSILRMKQRELWG